jgi:hypothetical protein
LDDENENENDDINVTREEEMDAAGAAMTTARKERQF